MDYSKFSVLVQIRFHGINDENMHIPLEGHNLANQNSRKLGVFDRKLVGSHSTFIIILDKSNMF